MLVWKTIVETNSAYVDPMDWSVLLCVAAAVVLRVKILSQSRTAKKMRGTFCKMAKIVMTICLKTYWGEAVKQILWFTIIIIICSKCFRGIEKVMLWHGYYLSIEQKCLLKTRCWYESIYYTIFLCFLPINDFLFVNHFLHFLYYQNFGFANWLLIVSNSWFH